MRLSKYKKNLKVEDGEVFSYNTLVATIEGDKLIANGYYSMTTSKHINYVACELGLEVVR